jgi:DNA-binding winged helix-turn-helix (wHTH) protein
MLLRMNEIYSFGSFGLETRERRLTHGGRPVPLRPKVFDTLCALIERHGKLVTKDELMKLVWPDAVVEENNLALNVAALRKALRNADPQGKWIETVTGKGYRFRGGVRLVAGGGQAEAPQRVNQVVNRAQAVLLERERELALLRESLQRAGEGRRQFACITGEAGIGKTALLDAFLDPLRMDGGPLIGIGQCVEHVGGSEAYMPGASAVAYMARTLSNWLTVTRPPGLLKCHR